jgi:formate-dependent nitrite reductase membrane component NrfD
MKILRFILVLAVLGYAGWLAWPFLAPFFEGASPDAAAMRAGAEAQMGGGLPVAALWIGAVGLYLVAAMLLGSGNPKAAIAYFLGFIADAVLRLAIDRGGAGNNEIAARSAEAAPMAANAGIDPTWLILGVLVAVGLLILVVSRRRRVARTPGQLSF